MADRGQQVFDSMPLRLFLLLFLASALTNSTNLPWTVLSNLPPCSIECVEYFVTQYYPESICPDTTDLACLCTHNTSSGFTLGEAALRCLVASCSNSAAFQPGAYGLCDGIYGAVPETHSTLTATLMAATTVVPSYSTTATTSIASTNSIPTSILTAPATTFPSVATSNPTASQSTPLTTADPQTTQPASPRASTVLTTPQIVGISIGGAAGATLAFSLLCVACCIRRRRRRKEEEEKDWSYDSAPSERPLGPTSPYQPSRIFQNATMVGQRPETDLPTDVPPPSEEKRRSFWRKSIKPEEIGVAVTPEIPQNSPASANSNNTTSQLLPEMPKYSLWPAPLRISQQMKTEEQAKKETEKEIEGEKQKEMEGNPGTVEPPASRPPRIVSSRTGNGLPTDPRARMYALERRRSQNYRMPLTPVYDNGIPLDWRGPLPSNLGKGTNLQVPNQGLATGLSPGIASRREPSSVYSEPPPADELATEAAQSQRSGPVQLTRASSRYSNTSESTNFDLDDYDYERDSNASSLDWSSGPEVQRTTLHLRPTMSMLSPVVESPRFPPPPRQPSGPDDPFVSPTRNPKGNRAPPYMAMNRKPVAGSYFQGQRPLIPNQSTIRLVDNSNNPRRESPKDRLVAEGQSFLADDGTTPESEDTNISSGSAETYTQHNPTAPRRPGMPMGPYRPPQPQLLSPFRRQAHGPEQRLPMDQRPRMQPLPDTLWAKRRGSGTASTMAPAHGPIIHPETANRPRPPPPTSQYQVPQRSPPDEAPPMSSIWEAIGRGRYEAALQPPPPPRSPSNSTDSSQAVVGLVLDGSTGKGPMGTKLTPTRRENGDMFLRVG